MTLSLSLNHLSAVPSKPGKLKSDNRLASCVCVTGKEEEETMSELFARFEAAAIKYLEWLQFIKRGKQVSEGLAIPNTR